MQTLPNRTRAVLVALLVVCSTAALTPMASGVPMEGYSQQDGEEGPANTENATAVDSLDGIEGTIGADGSPDVYAVELNEGSGIELTDGTVGGGPIELLDRDGTVLDTIPAGTNFTGEEYTLRTQAEYTGTYYLRVGGEAGDEYEINSRVTEPDASEPDDTLEDATAIDPGEGVQGTAIKGDADIYALELEAGTDIGIEANGTAAAEGSLLGPDGEGVASSEILYPGGYAEGELGRERIIETTAEQGGTYYLEVAIPENYTGDVNGDYDLTVVEASEGNGTEPSDDSAPDDSSAEGSTPNESSSNESMPDDGSTGDAEDGNDARERSDAEPNDDIGTATRANEQRAINGDIDGAGDVDYYALNATAGSQFEISQGVGSSEITLTLLDENGNTVATRPYQSTYQNEESLLIANASETGTYYLRVEGEAGDRYSIGVGITEPDTYEPNDAIDSAMAIDAGGGVTGTILRGDTDYFAIEAAAGERLAVNATGIGSSRATLFGPEGEAIESGRIHAESSRTLLDEPSARTVLDTTVGESGTYYIEVEQAPAYTGEIDGEYTLTVIESDDSAATTTATETETTEGTETDETTTDGKSNDTSEPSGTETEHSETTGSGTTVSDADDTDTTSPESDTPTEERTDGTTATDTTTTTASTSTGGGTRASDESSSNSETTDASTETSTDAGTGAGTETAIGSDDDSVVEDAEETAVNGPGFGIVAALLALLGAALLATRRN